MKIVNGYWVDKSNNMWLVSDGINYITEEEAEEYSKSLMGSKYCIGCNDW